MFINIESLNDEKIFILSSSIFIISLLIQSCSKYDNIINLEDHFVKEENNSYVVLSSNSENNKISSKNYIVGVKKNNLEIKIIIRANRLLGGKNHNFKNLSTRIVKFHKRGDHLYLIENSDLYSYYNICILLI